MSSQQVDTGAEFRAGADWKFAMMGAFAQPRARRVYTSAELQALAQTFRPGVAAKTVREVLELFVAGGALRKVGHGIYLNRKCIPAAELTEVARHIRNGAVISLQSVLGECGFLNNPSAIATAVLPMSPSKRPNLGDVETQTGDVFRFYGVSERLFPQTADEEWRMLQPGRPCPTFRPEAALLHWLHLASGSRSTMTMPPVDVDMDVLDKELLSELAKEWGMKPVLSAWLSDAKSRDFGEEHVPAARTAAKSIARAKPRV
jgi:hypothetical protein